MEKSENKSAPGSDKDCGRRAALKIKRGERDGPVQDAKSEDGAAVEDHAKMVSRKGGERTPRHFLGMRGSRQTGQGIGRQQFMMRPLPPKIAKVLEQPAAFTPCRNYKIETKLGHGGHGAVFLARHIASHRLIAVKMTKVDENTFAEVAMLKQCSHDNILRVLDLRCDEAGENLFVYLELCRGGELFNRIATSQTGRMEQHIAARYFQQLMSAIAYIHGLGIAHRDIKPENLLMNDTDDVIICDFGLAVSVDRESRSLAERVAVLKRDAPESAATAAAVARMEKFLESKSKKSGKAVETSKSVDKDETPFMAKSRCGTPLYAAPEVWNSGSYDPLMVDVWSAGVVLFCMLMGHPPFSKATPNSRTFSIYKEGNYVFPPALGEDTIDFLRFILQVDPQKRPTAEEVLQHGWFQSKLARGRKRKLVTESQQSSRVQFPLNMVKPVAEGQVVRDMISANPPQKIIDHIHSAALVDVMKRPPRIDPLDIDSFIGHPGAALRGSAPPTFARPEMMQRAPPRVMSLADHLLNAVRNRQLERRRRQLGE